MEKNEILYILMRSDMASLNPGKAMAQASHASNQFIFNSYKFIPEGPELSAVKRWQNQTKFGFGTVLVLDAFDESGIFYAIENARKEELICDLVIDPSYPLIDGDYIHHITDVLTCCYIFSDSGKLEILENFPLYN